MIDGVRFYYPGFRQAIKNKKNHESVMADSFLQSFLKNLIGDFLKSKIDKKTWMVLVGETGSHINLNNNLGMDIVIFDRTEALKQRNLLNYSNIPPNLVIEIDVNVVLPDPNSDLFQEYVVPKINRLFDFGTKKVVWVFTKSKKILSATPGQPWQFFDLGQEIPMMETVTMNLQNLMDEEGINPEFY